MNVEEKQYAVKKIVVESKVWRYRDRQFDVTRKEWELIIGAQERVYTETLNNEISVYKIPASPLDWVKSLIVGFESSLNFGWLIPSMKEFSVVQKVEIHNHYWNVLPKPEDFGDVQTVQFYKMSGCSKMNFSELDLLESEPPTKEEVQIATLDAKKMAQYLSAYRSL